MNNEEFDDILDISIYDEEYLFEMSEVYPKYIIEHNPRINFHISVPQGKEGPIPHFHMSFGSKRNKNKKDTSFIRLDIPEYSPHHDDYKKLNRLEKEELVKFMNTLRISTRVDGSYEYYSCWKECVDLWINNHGDPYNLFEKDKNGNYIMPDYSLL
jgi:hypothetical protein